MNGSQYEILVYNADETDMMDIVSALVEADIEGDNRDEIGMYLRDGKANSVFVNPTNIGTAVEIINGLGFETDEDGLINFDGLDEMRDHLNLMEYEGWYQIRDEDEVNWLVPPDYQWNEAAKEKRIRL